MIQRKQSLFLFFAALVLSLDFFFPLAEFISAKESIVLYIYKIISLVPDSTMPFHATFVLPLLSINILCIALSILAIFMYKNRKVQMKIVKLTLLLVVVQVGLFFLYYVDTLEKYTQSIAEYNYFGVSALLIAILLYVLGYRGIVQDERLIRNSDRLR